LYVNVGFLLYYCKCIELIFILMGANINDELLLASAVVSWKDVPDLYKLSRFC